MSKAIVPFCVFLAIFCSACLEKDGRATLSVLKKCLASDSLGDELIYLGPSNQVGPGAIYRKRSDGKWALSRQLKDALPSDVIDKIILAGRDVTCSGRFSVTRDFVADFAPFLRSYLRGAQTVIVSVEAAAVDLIEEGPFGDEIAARLPINFFGNIRGIPPLQELEERRKFAATTAYVEELLRPNRVLLRSAIRVRGLAVEIQFSDNAAGELHRIGVTSAETSSQQPPTSTRAPVLASWSDTLTLSLKSLNDVYLFGERAQANKTTDAGGGSAITLTPTKISDLTRRPPGD